MNLRGLRKSEIAELRKTASTEQLVELEKQYIQLETVRIQNESSPNGNAASSRKQKLWSRLLLISVIVLASVIFLGTTVPPVINKINESRFRYNMSKLGYQCIDNYWLSTENANKLVETRMKIELLKANPPVVAVKPPKDTTKK